MMMMMMIYLYIIGAVCVCVCNEKVTLREKFTHVNCTLPTIHLGPAGRRPAWAKYYDDDGDDSETCQGGPQFQFDPNQQQHLPD